MNERLLTYEDFAETLGISLRTAIRLRDSGAIRSVKLGRLVRFKQSEVEAFIERGCVPATLTRRPERIMS